MRAKPIWLSIGLMACAPRTIDVSAAKGNSTVDENAVPEEQGEDDAPGEQDVDDEGEEEELSDTEEEQQDTEEDDETEQEFDRVADFTLTDLNAGSLTYGQEISPRNYMQQTTGWYFIKAT